MKSKYILASLFCLAAFSCSDDKSFEPAYTGLYGKFGS